MMIPEISFAVEAEWKNARCIGIGTAYCGTSGARLKILMKTIHHTSNLFQKCNIATFK